MAAERGMLMQISEKIRAIRSEKGITLKQLSSHTGLSVSFLSQVERGASSLAIPSLEKIAEGLDVSIADFFVDTGRQRYVTYRSGLREERSENTSSILVRLAGEFHGRRLEPLLVTLNPGQHDKKEYKHPGEEFYYVMEGEVIFIIQDKEYHLKKGDSIHFPSDITHTWRNPLSEESQLLGVVIPIL